jgi:hypothetical protein
LNQGEKSFFEKNWSGCGGEKRLFSLRDYHEEDMI